MGRHVLTTLVCISKIYAQRTRYFSLKARVGICMGNLAIKVVVSAVTAAQPAAARKHGGIRHQQRRAARASQSRRSVTSEACAHECNAVCACVHAVCCLPVRTEVCAAGHSEPSDLGNSPPTTWSAMLHTCDTYVAQAHGPAGQTSRWLGPKARASAVRCSP
jgi:hypothetical protein